MSDDKHCQDKLDSGRSAAIGRMHETMRRAAQEAREMEGG